MIKRDRAREIKVWGPGDNFIAHLPREDSKVLSDVFCEWKITSISFIKKNSFEKWITSESKSYEKSA